jgi:hypothetical protein
MSGDDLSLRSSFGFVTVVYKGARTPTNTNHETRTLSAVVRGYGADEVRCRGGNGT